MLLEFGFGVFCRWCPQHFTLIPGKMSFEIDQVFIQMFDGFASGMERTTSGKVPIEIFSDFLDEGCKFLTCAQIALNSGLK